MPRPRKTSYAANKPPYSYVALCAMAIHSCEDKMMTLSDIYKFIEDNFPFYRENSKRWQNSLRHNLSFNDCFVKVSKSCPQGGKGSYWTLHDSCSHMFRDGSLLRRKHRFHSHEEEDGEGVEEDEAVEGDDVDEVMVQVKKRKRKPGADIDVLGETPKSLTKELSTTTKSPIITTRTATTSTTTCTPFTIDNILSNKQTTTKSATHTRQKQERHEKHQQQQQQLTQQHKQQQESQFPYKKQRMDAEEQIEKGWRYHVKLQQPSSICSNVNGGRNEKMKIKNKSSSFTHHHYPTTRQLAHSHPPLSSTLAPGSNCGPSVVPCGPSVVSHCVRPSNVVRTSNVCVRINELGACSTCCDRPVTVAAACRKDNIIGVEVDGGCGVFDGEFTQQHKIAFDDSVKQHNHPLYASPRRRRRKTISDCVMEHSSRHNEPSSVHLPNNVGMRESVEFRYSKDIRGHNLRSAGGRMDMGHKCLIREPVHGGEFRYDEYEGDRNVCTYFEDITKRTVRPVITNTCSHRGLVQQKGR